LNIRVNRQAFLKTLRIVNKAAVENKIRPIISCVNLETSDSKIILKGTNLELTLISELECEVLEDGKIVFSHQLVEEYLKEISDSEVNLVERDGKLIIETSDSQSEFSLFDASEYPLLREIVGEESFTLEKEKFVNLLEKGKFSAAQSSENLAINCLRIEIKDKKLKLISTDTYRLVYLEEEVDFDKETGVSIPLKSVDILIKTLKEESNETVEIRFEGNQIAFKIGKTFLFTRVIEVPYPNYEGILKGTKYDKEATIITEEFVKVLKRVLIFVKNNSESKNSAIFEFLDNELQIRGISEIAKVKELMPILKDGDDLKISLNVKFILDYLQFISKDQDIVMQMSNSNGAIFLKEINSEKFVYLVMPLALRD